MREVHNSEATSPVSHIKTQRTIPSKQYSQVLTVFLTLIKNNSHIILYCYSSLMLYLSLYLFQDSIHLTNRNSAPAQPKKFPLIASNANTDLLECLNATQINLTSRDLKWNTPYKLLDLEIIEELGYTGPYKKQMRFYKVLITKNQYKFQCQNL